MESPFGVQGQRSAMFPRHLRKVPDPSRREGSSVGGKSDRCLGVSISIARNVERDDARYDGDILGFLRDLLDLVLVVGEETIEEGT